MVTHLGVDDEAELEVLGDLSCVAKTFSACVRDDARCLDHLLGVGLNERRQMEVGDKPQLGRGKRQPRLLTTQDESTFLLGPSTSSLHL